MKAPHPWGVREGGLYKQIDIWALKEIQKERKFGDCTTAHFKIPFSFNEQLQGKTVRNYEKDCTILRLRPQYSFISTSGYFVHIQL